MKILNVLAAFGLAALCSSPVLAATASNATSPLGINLNYLSYYDPEEPFLNIFKTTAVTAGNPSAWSTRDASMNETNEESYLQLDSSGYPASLKASSSDPNSPQKFTQACAIILRLQPSNAGTGLPYQAGQYVVLYDGVGTIQVGMDASMVSTSQSATGGRDVFNVAKPTQNGVWICVSSTSATNHLNNIRVVKAEDESLLDAGQIYTPGFLGLMQNFGVIRGMQWQKMDDNPGPPGTWADRAQLTDAGWGSEAGAPLEALVSLCNAVGADCWLNVPQTADDNYITQMATLVHQQLGSTQKVYVEFSNEVWNGIYPQNKYATSEGAALWPSATSSQDNRDWYGMRTAQMCDIWAQVWGSDDARVHCVLGAQAAVPSTATESLNCPLWTAGAPCYKHHITDVAIAPYFSWGAMQTPSAWNALDVAAALNDIFNQITAGGEISGATAALAQVSGWEAAYKKALAPYGLPYIAYEGGQSLLGFPAYMNGSAVVNEYIAANRDARMGTAYTTALNDWKANGGETYVLYDDVYFPGEYGEWGLLESFMDTVSPLTSAPPKWQATQSFITNNPCWWSGCARTVADAPQAPSGFKVAN